ncbi:MAG: trypsin-like peptidase domain-containing protein [Planctomycetota bacterium]
MMFGIRPLTCLLLLFFCVDVTAEDAASSDETIRKAVVKIYSIRRSYSLSSPWKRLTATTVTGSGVVLSPTRVLTNHHVVAATTDVSISLDGQSDRVSGRVFASSPGLDLALIELEEPLSDEIVPLEVAKESPAAGDKIQVFGYPKGGDSLSITEGVVSRMEHVRYRYNTFGLRTQIDAPLNNGNSGGPMIANGKIVGIAFSGLSSSNDIGYAISCEEIKTALEDLEDGVYDGKPQLWINTHTLASAELRRWLKLPEGESGIQFAAMPIPVEDYPLQAKDVITQIGEFDVNNLGRVDLDEKTQVSFIYAAEQSASNGVVPVKVFRDGKPMQLEVPAFRDDHYLLGYLRDQAPTYFVYGPLVFGIGYQDYWAAMDSVLTQGGNNARGVLAMMSSMSVRENPYLMRRHDRVMEDEQLVIINKLIRNRMTRDVVLAPPAVVKSINGKQIRSTRQAAEILANLEGDQLVIELDDNRGSTVVLDRKQLEREHENIMEENGIVRSASPDLRDVWTK